MDYDYLQFLLVKVDALLFVCGLLGMDDLRSDMGLDEVGLPDVAHAEHEVELPVLLGHHSVLGEHHSVRSVLEEVISRRSLNSDARTDIDRP